MRGKRLGAVQDPPKTRLIPAHAGKTQRCSEALETDWAHPRACGENCPRAVPVAHELGSSPRMRGKLGGLMIAPNRAGLIPAHAGKTEMGLTKRLCVWAHPRACGENWCNSANLCPFEGSSPRMRGKLFVSTTQTLYCRLIPAHAGKTLSMPLWRHVRRAHPRACGENLLTAPATANAMGSSPRMRGKRDIAGSP